MAYLNYLLVAIISYLGLGFGALLYTIAPEEYKPGKKHITALKHIILGAILAIMLINETSLFTIIVAIISIAAYSFTQKFSYAILAVLFFIFYNQNALNLIGCMVFLFGLTEGTLYAGETDLKLKKIYKILATRFYFFATLLLPLVLLYF